MDTTHLHGTSSLTINREAHEVTIDGLPIHLTNAEFTLLTTLADSPRRAFSSEHLTRVLSGSEWVAGTHGLQVTVSRLRRKLGESGTQPGRVVTVHGYGYRYEPDPTPNLDAALASNAQPTSVEQATQSAFTVVALDRTILWASDSFAHLLGWQPTELQGIVLYDLIHPDDRPHSMAAREGLNAGLASAFLFHLRTASGEYRLLEAIARPIIGPDGQTVSFLGEYRPATQAKISATATLHSVHLKQPQSPEQR